MNSTVSITWLRTSCLLIQTEGYTAITDPWFASTMRGLPVFAKPGIELADLPHIDYVFASHLHRDHFDPKAVTRFGHPKLEIAGTLGTQEHVARTVPSDRVGCVHDLWHWDEVQMGPFRVIGTPAVHTGPAPPEINLVIECPGGFRIFFGGDARWSSAYGEVAHRFAPIDVALLPVGGTLIFGHRTTLNPRDAVRVCRVMEPRWAIPIHEGGEWLPVPPASWHPGRCSDFEALLEKSSCNTGPVRLERGQKATFSSNRTAPLLEAPSN